MLAIYNKASICAFERPFDCGLKLQPDLKGIMARSRDWDELVYVWGEWRRKSGENMKELYEQLIDLTNEAARYNSTYWRPRPLMDDFNKMIWILLWTFSRRFHQCSRILDISIRIEQYPTGCGECMDRDFAIVWIASFVRSTQTSWILWSESYQSKCSAARSRAGQHVRTNVDQYIGYNDTISWPQFLGCHTRYGRTGLYAACDVPIGRRVLSVDQHVRAANRFLVRFGARASTTRSASAVSTVRVGFLWSKNVSHQNVYKCESQRSNYRSSWNGPHTIFHDLSPSAESVPWRCKCW